MTITIEQEIELMETYEKHLAANHEQYDQISVLCTKYLHQAGAKYITYDATLVKQYLDITMSTPCAIPLHLALFCKRASRFYLSFYFIGLICVFIIMKVKKSYKMTQGLKTVAIVSLNIISNESNLQVIKCHRILCSTLEVPLYGGGGV